MQHQARKYGVTKFGMDRFINGFLDLITISFLSKFGKRPMHFFGLWGSLMFIFGTTTAFYIGLLKLHKLFKGTKTILITDNPWFFYRPNFNDFRDFIIFSWFHWRINN